MTYTYTDDNGKPVTNVYSAHDSYYINQYIARFTPSIVKKKRPLAKNSIRHTLMSM